MRRTTVSHPPFSRGVRGDASRVVHDGERRTLPFPTAGALLVLFTIMIAVNTITGPLTFTGDEPRYVSQGTALYSGSLLYPSQANWASVLRKSGLTEARYPYAEVIAHEAPSLAPGFVFGGILRLAGLHAARWLNFAIGCVGLVTLYRLLLREYASTEKYSFFVAVAMFCVSLSLPFIAYLKVLYPEILLFVAVAYALFGLSKADHLATAFASATLPICHVRALPLSVAFMVVLMWQTAREEPRRGRLPIVVLYLSILALGATAERAVAGSLLGPAFATYTPSFSAVPSRIAMQLFDVRHGLLAYSPLYALAFAGLIAGTIRQQRLCRYSLVLLLTYVATFMWSTAAESWTARFWVAGLPFLAVGLTFWLSRVRAWYQWLPALVCIGVSAANLALFCEQPAWFLENRRVSVSYASLFNVTHVYLGFFLPIDANPGGLPPDRAATPFLLLFAVCLIGALTLCALDTRWRPAGGLAALLVLAVPVVAGLQRALPSDRNRVSTSAASGTVTIVLTNGADRVSAIQLDAQLPRIWTARDFPSHFRVRCSTRGGHVTQSVEPSRAIIRVECRDVSKIELGTFPTSFGSTILAHLGPVTVLQSLTSPP